MSDDDVFAEMIKDLEEAKVEAGDDDLSKLSILELLDERERLDEKLSQLHEMLARNPSPEARELHSRRAAVAILLNNPEYRNKK